MSNVIDYFATIGSTYPLQCKGYSDNNNDNDNQNKANIYDIWNDAITDIIILSSNNSTIPDDTWELINTTIDGNEIKQTYPYLAIRRRIHSKRLDHIIDIQRIKGNKVPDGYEILSYDGLNHRNSSFDDTNNSNNNNNNSTSLDEVVDNSSISIDDNTKNLNEDEINTDMIHETNSNDIAHDTNNENFNQDDIDNSDETTTEIYGLRSVIGFIAIKRCNGSGASFIQDLNIINDICFFYKSDGEEPPEGYSVLNISKLSRLDRFSNKQKKYNEFMAFNMINGLGICDLRYESVTLDRYPSEDHKGISLPMKELPMFAFPHDLRLKYSEEGRFPMPIFFTFVFTDTMGDHIYAACLRFYEKVPRAEIERIFQYLYGKEHLPLLPQATFFSPKVLCVISRNPYYRALRKYLCQLYSMSMSSLPCPIEFYIASVVNLIPNPVAGGRPFHIVQDAALISVTSKSMAPICLEVPAHRFFPHIDLDFAGPLRCLSVDNVLAIFALMLREAKLIFMCNSHVMLTETMESFRALLFPLKWSSCFVTRLPFELGGLLQAPGGFMIGIQVLENSNCDVEDSALEYKKSTSSNIYALKRDGWLKNISPGTYVIDLSANLIFQYDGKGEVQFNQSKVNALVHTLPLGPRARLYNKLDRIAKKYRIGPQKTGRKHFDSVFDFHGEIDESEEISMKEWKKFPTLDIRDSFMVLMIDILGDYPKYIIPASEDMTADTYRTFQEAFYIEEYLSDADDSMHVLLKSLLETQMFAVLMQQRAEASEYSTVFFEQCSSLLREIGFCAGGHGMAPHTHGPVHDMPALLYKLLQARDIEHFQPSFQTRQLSTLNTPTHRSSVDVSGTPRRLSGGVSAPVTPLAATEGAYNNQLSNLIDTLTEMEINDCKIIQIDQKGDTTINYTDELRTVEFSMLNDVNIGPLVLPGPIKVDREIITKTVRRDEDGRYIYEGTWPRLDKVLLAEASNFIHPRITPLRNYRESHIENTNPTLTSMVRPFSERISHIHSMQLCTKVVDSQIFLVPECATLIGTYIDILSMVLLLLQIRVVNQSKPTSDVLQLLGLLAQLEDLNLLSYLEENVWRGILTCIGSTGGDFMRRIACVIYNIMEAYGKTPDAMTFGAYMKALSMTKMSKNDNITGGQVDLFLFLEEIGLTWFIQRSALMKESAGTAESNNSPIRNKMKDIHQEKTESTLTSMLSVLRRPKKQFTPRSFAKKHVIVKLTGSASLVSSELSLKKAGLLSSFTPHGFYGCNFVRNYSNLIGDSESTVMDSIQEWISGVHVQATPHPISSPTKDSKRLAFERQSVDKRDSATSTFTEFTDSTESTSTIDSPIRKQIARMGTMMYNNSPSTSQLMASASKSLAFKTPSMFSSGNSESKSGRWTSRFGNILNRMQGIEHETPHTTSTTDVELEDLSPIGVLHNKGPDFSDDEDSASVSSKEDDDVKNSDIVDNNKSENEEIEPKAFELIVPDNIPTNKSVEKTERSELHVDVNANDTESKSNDSRLKRINILNVQTEIEQLYANDFSSKGYAMGIFSNIPCSCGYCYLDEEILASWTNIDKEKEIKLAHCFQCINCRNPYTPQLQVNCYKKSNAKDKVDLVWSKLIPYLSPYYLRNELEQAIEVSGNKIIDATFVYESFPTLFWGMLWYTSRLALPSGFLCIPNPSENIETHILSRSPISVGWRESIVEKKVINLLWHLQSPYEYNISFNDIFPSCNEDEEALTERFAKSMDGSLAGMRTAMIQFSAEIGMLDKIPSISKERKLYIGLLSIAHLHNSNIVKTSNSNPSNTIQIIESGILFEKIFIDTINCNLSPSDAETMNMKEQLLLTSSSNKLAQAYRIAFSFLF